MDAWGYHRCQFLEFIRRPFRGGKVLFEATEPGYNCLALLRVYGDGHSSRRMSRSRNKLNSRKDFTITTYQLKVHPREQIFLVRRRQYWMRGISEPQLLLLNHDLCIPALLRIRTVIPLQVRLYDNI